jgi:hypothetical protein
VNAASLAAPLAALVRGGVSPAAGAVVELGDDAWERLLAVARRHEVSPLVSAGLASAAAAPPKPVRDALRQDARLSEIRVARGLEQLERAVAALNAAGAEPLLLKGALFAVRNYRSPGLRPFSDLDLLVPRAERERAAEALLGLGYARYRDRNQREVGWWDENHHHWGFAPESGLRVELHWDLAPPTSGVRLDAAALWARSERLDCPGGRGRALALEDELVHLAVHAAKHQLRVPLRQYADLAALLATSPPPDWEAVRRRAAEAGAGIDLAAYLGVAAGLGLVSLPAGVEAWVRQDARPHLDLPLLARYALEWPWRERPYALLDTLAAPSLGAAARTLRRALSRGAGCDDAPGPDPPPTSPGFLDRVRRLAAEATGVRAQLMIRRQFRDREAP